VVSADGHRRRVRTVTMRQVATKHHTFRVVTGALCVACGVRP
jgi:hypothetical protein